MKIMIMTKGDLSTVLFRKIVTRIPKVQAIYTIDTSNINDDLNKYIDTTIHMCDIVFVDGYSYAVASKYYYEADKDRSNIIPIVDPDVIINICISICDGKSIKRSMLDYVAELLKYIANNLVDDNAPPETSK